MKGFFRRFDVVSWPIWAKLLGGFLVAILVPAALILFVVLVGIREIGQQSIESLVTETGVRNAQIITGELAHVRESLGEFVADPVHVDRLFDLLLTSGSSVQTGDGDASNRILDLFKATLLPVEASKFLNVRVLDRNGGLIFRASSAGLLAFVPGEDDSESPAFRDLVNAQIQGESATLTVSQPTSVTPTIEVGQVLYWRDGTPIGFMIGTVDVAEALYKHLDLDLRNEASARTFLMTQAGIMFTPASTRLVNEASRNSLAVELALQGETGIATYRVGAGEGQEVVGYYAPIPETPFVLITETFIVSPFTQVLNYFSGARAFTVVIGMVLLMAVLVMLFNQLLSPPLLRLRQAITAMRGGNYHEPVPATSRGDEIGSLATAFVDMREHVRKRVSELENRVAMRTRDINATQEISHFAAAQRDVQSLMEQVVNLIVEQFTNIYHAQIFLLDSDRQWAVLQASTGEAGRLLLARGHRLAVGSVSLIGQVTEQGRVVVARDTATSRVHRRNEFLPETRAELAIPLKVGARTIGALDVQSQEGNAFSDDEISVLQTMADQIAVAIENARLYQESVRRLEEIERSNRLATLNAWERYMHEQRTLQLSSVAGVTTGLDMSDLRRQALALNQVVVGDLTERQTVPIAVPIQLRGQALGAVEWELPAQDFDDNKLQLAQELANRLALSLDNARLFQESQRTTERERLVSSIAAKLTGQTDIEEILQTAVREVGQALRSPQVSIRLHRANGDVHNGNGNE
jgi:GAF domain-containing protein/HAMP domain-containing protein